MKLKIFFLISIFLPFLFSCGKKPNIHLKNIYPQHFKNMLNYNLTFEKNWWEYLNNRELNELITQGLKNNYNIKIALTKINQAKEYIIEKESLLFPDISINAGRSKSKQHLHNLPPFIPKTIETRLYNGNLLASYEIDFWGKLKNLSENSKHLFLLQKYSFEIVKKTVASNIAILYFRILKNRAKLKILKNILSLLNFERKILKNKYEKGLINVNTIYQINAKIAEIKSSIPMLQAIVNNDKYLLNFLVHNSVSNNFKIVENKVDINNLKIPSNLPSDVLKRRPDVKVAIEKIFAEANIVNYAKANIFPSFKLTGQYGFENKNLSDLIRNSSSLYSWVTNIFMTVFDFGAKNAKVRLEKEKLKQLKLEYYRKVLEVCKDVEIALINFKKLKEKYKNLISELNDYKKIFYLKKSDYKHGISSLIEMINCKNDILNVQLKIIENKFEIIQQYIKTLKELGY